jgi:hypothetical protein
MDLDQIIGQFSTSELQTYGIQPLARRNGLLGQFSQKQLLVAALSGVAVAVVLPVAEQADIPVLDQLPKSAVAGLLGAIVGAVAYSWGQKAASAGLEL